LKGALLVTQDAMTIGSLHAHIPLWEEFGTRSKTMR
jgi:hypothetical protein